MTPTTKDNTVNNNLLLRSPQTKEYKENYRSIFGHSAATKKKGRYFMVKGVGMIHEDEYHARYEEKKPFLNILRRFDAFYHYGIGEMVYSRRDMQEKYRKHNVTEVGTEKWKPKERKPNWDF